MLERDAPYVQIIEHYRQEIRAGRLKDGDMLPSGREIAAAVRRVPGHRRQGRHRPAGPRPGHPPARAPAPWSPRPGRPPTGPAAGPLLITLASRSPARPGDKARVLEAGSSRRRRTSPRNSASTRMAQVIRRRQVTIRDGATAAVLTSWFPAALGEVVAGPAPQDAGWPRTIERLPARLGRGLGVRAAADVGGGPRVRHQARLTGRRRAQPPVRRRRHRPRVRRADRPRRHPRAVPLRLPADGN